MQFIDKVVSREGCTLSEIGAGAGAGAGGGGAYLSISVSMGVVDYEEYCSISNERAQNFESAPGAALDFSDQCRRANISI